MWTVRPVNRQSHLSKVSGAHDAADRTPFQSPAGHFCSAGVFCFLGVNFSPCRGLPVRAYAAFGKEYGMVQREVNEIVRLQRCGYGYKKIAQITGLPVNGVKTYCRRHPLAQGNDADVTVCKQCGKVVTQEPHRKQKLFCSDACRMAWWNAHPGRVNRKAYYTFTCALCGRAFESYGNPNRKFCSRA